jgi:hypothetical protein
MSYEYGSTVCCDVIETWDTLKACLLDVVPQCEECGDGVRLRFKFGEDENSWGSDGELVLNDRDLLLAVHSGTRDQREALLHDLNRVLASKGCAELEEL